MIDKKQARLRRARKTRAKIAELKSVRLSVHRSNCHIYAQVISACGSKVLAAASSLEPEVRKTLPNGGDMLRLNMAVPPTPRSDPNFSSLGIVQAAVLGLTDRAKKAGVEQVAFDRSGFQYHGRIKALAEAAREAGLKF